MKLMFILLAAATLLELLVFVTPLWRWRKVVTVIVMITGMFVVGALFAWHPNTLSGLILLAGFCRAFNSVRIVKERMHERYLHRATCRTGLVMIAIQGLLLTGWWAWYQTPENRRTVWLTVAALQVFVAAVLLASTIRRLNRTRPVPGERHYSDAQLPSVTVAIPARNETEDLQECLLSLVASDYPKLEIIVLDDCSQDKHTPEIIRSFAHDGVRFIQGELPKPTWLAKNQAYDRLAASASGEFILFCGVDVRFAPDALRKLVTVMLDRKKAMASILPRHKDEVVSGVSIIQAMRYWWEIVPPRRLFARPSVISSCWIIQRKALRQVGGFAAVTRSVVPEAYFARALRAGDRYTFLRSDKNFGISSVKRTADQKDTAIRMRYPQLHRRPEQVFLTSLAEFTFLVLPFFMAIFGWWLPMSGMTHVLAIVAALLLVLSYELMAINTRVNNMAFGLIALPVVVLTDIFILHESMWRYEFSDVVWKGRNVCIPVMHVTPHLPKIES